MFGLLLSSSIYVVSHFKPLGHRRLIYKLAVVEGAAILALMFYSVKSLHLIDVTVIILITFGLIFYIDRRF